MSDKNLDELRFENNQLRDKLAHFETERINLLNEKERRERDCKNM